MAQTGPRRRPPARAAIRRNDRDVRGDILDAAERLLAECRFDKLSVADILDAANVARASFYFYFESKQAVLAELVRRAVGEGHEAAQPWLEHADDESPRQSIRHGIAEGARLWRERAPVLRAIVENWRTDDALAELWIELMGSYTTATIERIEHDRHTGRAPTTAIDAATLASTLTWLGERLYYLAAIGVAPFDDEERLVDALTEVWMAAVYGEVQPSQPRSRAARRRPVNRGNAPKG